MLQHQTSCTKRIKKLYKYNKNIAQINTHSLGNHCPRPWASMITAWGIIAHAVGIDMNMYIKHHTDTSEKLETRFYCSHLIILGNKREDDDIKQLVSPILIADNINLLQKYCTFVA